MTSQLPWLVFILPLEKDATGESGWKIFMFKINVFQYEMSRIWLLGESLSLSLSLCLLSMSNIQSWHPESFGPVNESPTGIFQCCSRISGGRVVFSFPMCSLILFLFPFSCRLSRWTDHNHRASYWASPEAWICIADVVLSGSEKRDRKFEVRLNGIGATFIHWPQVR